MGRKHGAAARAIRDIEDTINCMHAELQHLERARDVLVRRIEENGERCDKVTPLLTGGDARGSCAGQIYARFCRQCGAVFSRCEDHGGARAAAYDLRRHSEHEHGLDAIDPAAKDEGRVRSGGETVPVGGLSASPGDRDLEGEAEGSPRGPEGDDDPTQPPTEGQGETRAPGWPRDDFGGLASA